uniref:Uncharacterized protein n=1 Tax=Timema poppense TaxID=170557 RepID=A0A7R9H1L0_TIMPO|nr:unnamed protein product [Timema poppensis]
MFVSYLLPRLTVSAADFFNWHGRLQVEVVWGPPSSRLTVERGAPPPRVLSAQSRQDSAVARSCLNVEWKGTVCKYNIVLPRRPSCRDSCNQPPLNYLLSLCDNTHVEWLLACFEPRLLSDTNGLEFRWSNSEVNAAHCQIEMGRMTGQ